MQPEAAEAALSGKMYIVADDVTATVPASCLDENICLWELPEIFYSQGLGHS